MQVEFKVVMTLGNSDYKGNKITLSDDEIIEVLKNSLRKGMELFDYTENKYPVDIKSIETL
jgi:hypothetical protein